MEFEKTFYSQQLIHKDKLEVFTSPSFTEVKYTVDFTNTTYCLNFKIAPKSEFEEHKKLFNSLVAIVSATGYVRVEEDLIDFLKKEDIIRKIEKA